MRRGITLVELLVVLAILLALVAVALPVAHVVRARSLASGCLSNLGQIGKAVIMYADDHQDWLPPYLTQSSRSTTIVGVRDPSVEIGTVILTVGRPKEWRDALAKYTRSAEVFWCPADRYRRERVLADGDWPEDDRQLYTSYQTTAGKALYCVIVNNTYRPGKIRPPGGGAYRVPSTQAEIAYLQDAIWEHPYPKPNHRGTSHGHRLNHLFFDGRVGSVDIRTGR